MPDRDAILRALHCRGQDLMIDAPACDQCEYHFEMPNGSGCDFRRLCRDAAELMAEQEAVVRCKDCKWYIKKFENEGRCIKHDNDYHEPDWFCADGERKEKPHLTKIKTDLF